MCVACLITSSMSTSVVYSSSVYREILYIVAKMAVLPYHLNRQKKFTAARGVSWITCQRCIVSMPSTPGRNRLTIFLFAAIADIGN